VVVVGDDGQEGAGTGTAGKEGGSSKM